jgi:hypothetical protein
MAQNVLSEQTVLNSSVGRESAQNRDKGAKLKVEISSLLTSELTLFLADTGCASLWTIPSTSIQLTFKYACVQSSYYIKPHSRKKKI